MRLRNWQCKLQVHSIFSLDQQDVSACSNITSSMAANQPTSALCVMLFEYEMKLQQVRASADFDRLKTEARLDAERARTELERSRAEISDMKLRMMSIVLNTHS